MNRLESLLDYAKNHVPFQRRRAPKHHLVLRDWPFMSKHDLVTHSLDISNDLLSEIREPGGSILASGGTTATPKYVYYSHSEVAAASRNIADHLMANGMESGDRVVNYFDSGDLWSAFLLADKALCLLPVTVFPVGYTGRMENALQVLERLQPNVIVGVPSMILSFAHYCVSQGKQVAVRKVFYGGESMTCQASEALVSIWGCDLVRSIGYASTEVGSIGWQCPHCKTGEHYPFEDMLVEIVDDEIVATSLTRRAMPIIRYRTGDRGEWVTPSCDCARGAPAFRLCGRLDNAMIIWGCWVLYDDLVKALEDLDIGFTAVQAHVYSTENGAALAVKFESLVQSALKPDAQLRDKFYERSRDLRSIVTRGMLDQCLSFEKVSAGTLQRNARTGKVIPIIDSRVGC